MDRYTKIIITLGPKSSPPDILTRLIEKGVDGIRLNLAYGTRKEQMQMARRVRDVAGKVGRVVALIGDISGPKFRVGEIEEGAISLVPGENTALSIGKGPKGMKSIPVRDSSFFDFLAPGDAILLADGTIELSVEARVPEGMVCRVVVGGVLTSGKGINLPGSALKIDPLGSRGKEDLAFGVEAGLDYFSLSFVREQDDVSETKRILREEMNSDIPIIAKIERPEAVSKIEWILNAADGLMVARGDLGVETPLEEVPIIQKSLIAQARQAGKPVITATQMLRSMVEHSRPTRAEVSDVANAILDGTDAVMLSEETAVGNYPVESVEMMVKIAQSIERSWQSRPDRRQTFPSFFFGQQDAKTSGLRGEEPENHVRDAVANSVSHSAVVMAKDLNAAVIVTPTRSGLTPRLVSRYRSFVPILAMSPREETVRRLAICFGVRPVLVGEMKSLTEIVQLARESVMRENMGKRGNRVVITAGDPEKPRSAEIIKAEIL